MVLALIYKNFQTFLIFQIISINTTKELNLFLAQE